MGTRAATSLQVPVDRDPERTGRALTARLAARFPDRAVRVHPPSPVVGAGSANETLVAAVEGLDTPSIVVRVVVPSSQVFPGTSVERQAAALAHVAAHSDVPVPAVLDVDHDGEAVGAPMMIMERMPGRAPLDFPSYAVEGFLLDLSADERRALWSSGVDAIARLAVVDVTGLTLPGLPRVDGDVLGERVEYLRRYRREHLGATPPDPLVDAGLDALVRTVPSNPPAGLSWGDARLGNLLFDGTHVSAVLDWEIVTLAGPLFDLAWWRMFDRIHAEDLAGARPDGIGDPAETAAVWSARTGLGLDDLAWHELYVHLHLAMVRHRAFADRAAMGLPVPGPDDPRHVDRLLARVRRLLDDGTLDEEESATMTSTTGPFTAADALRHDLTPGVERWQETAMFSWYDARTRCGGYHHVDLQPAADRSCLWSWTVVDGVVAGKFQSLNLPLRPGTDVVDPAVGPTRVRTVEPFAWYDLAVHHPGGAAESVALEVATPLLYHAMPGDDAGPDAPQREHRGAADYSSSGTGHYEMLGRVRGTVSDGGGTTREVDGWGFHDHSWGPRTYGGLTATHRWVHMAFGPDLQASLYSIGTDTDRRTYGFVVRDGRVSRIADLDVEVTIGTDGHTPRRCEGVFRDTVGRAHAFSGEMHVASVSTHDGGYFVTDAYGEFRMGDRVGSGLLAVRERATPSAEHRLVLAEHDDGPTGAP